MYFQNIISSLNNFWSEKGCLLLQPYDLEKGAGTMSPHSVLRAIGPEPWSVAYPEPVEDPQTVDMAKTPTVHSITFNIRF